MPYTDHAIKKVTITSEDVVIDMQEFIDHVKNWFENNGYGVNEKTYLALPGNKTQIKWECEKKPDDYNKYQIKVKFDLKANQEAKGKRKLSKGTVKFAYEGKLIRDYDKRWIGMFAFFIRAIHDRFIVEEKQSDVLKEFKKDVDRLSKLIKQYLVI